VIDNSVTYDGFGKIDQISSFSHTINNDAPSSRLTISAVPDIDMQTNPFELMLNLPGDFDWEIFDTQIRPQLPAIEHTWPDLNTDFENMNDDYDYNIQGDTAYQP
jgi:hypothetical protein